MTMVDEAKPPGSGGRRRPSLVFRAVYAMILSALSLAILIPALVSRGIVVGPWLPWAVVGVSLVLFLGPALVGRRN